MTRARHTSLLKKIGIEAPFPESVEPMLATLAKDAFDDPDWIYEVKWDGYRIMGHVNKGKAVLRSRGLKNYSSKYTPITEALAGLKHDAVIDGEVLVLRDGIPSFSALQNYKPSDEIVYYVFDLLWLDGYDLTDATLVQRRELLASLVKGQELIRFSDSFDSGTQLYQLMLERELEGIIAKRKSSVYRPGGREKSWLKIPILKREEYIIIGWTGGSERGAAYYRSLLFAEYRDNELYYVHHTAGGGTDEENRDLLKRLKKIEVKKCPCVNKQDIEEDPPLHFVKPVLVGQFEKTNKITERGRIRHPVIFLGLREDKTPEEIEDESSKKPVRSPGKKAAKKKHKLSPSSNWNKIYEEKVETKEEVTVEGDKLYITNGERLVFRDITKLELIKYYVDIAPYILPYLKDRPLSLHIKPIDAYRPGFYIKDMEEQAPSWIDVFTDKRRHDQEGMRDVIDYAVCNKLSTLVYLINLGCIDLNPWLSTAQHPEEPDYVMIDVDPPQESHDYMEVVKIALGLKEMLDQYKLQGFPKTSGKKGMHIYIPCQGFTFEQTRQIAKLLCKELHEQFRSITTLTETVEARGDKIFLDYVQNDYADTIASPYSVRAHYQPYVSTPLTWEEIDYTLAPKQFTIKTISKRLEQVGDLMEGVFSKKVKLSNSKALKKMI
jgi:bifunctional non-homologous end joining protein LigD